ncbi:unnamed protein product [Withania somnifera]
MSSYLFPFCLFLITSTCLAQTNFKPKTLFLAVKKTLLLYNTLQKFINEHRYENLWVDCETGYKSSTYKSALCDSRQCNLARSTACGDCRTENTTRPGCNNNACYNIVHNPAMDTYYSGGEIAEDVLTIQSISRVRCNCPQVYLQLFSFVFNQNLGKDVKGMIGFGHQSAVSFATQLASAFKFSRQFAICFSSSTDKKGILFIGHRPYLFELGFDASKDLIYTPIITYPNFFHNKRASPEYYIQVSSIRINEKNLSLNRTFLSLDKDDEGGTRISTAVPYTVLEPSIYNVVSKAFISEMPKEVKSVSPVPPFKTCFDSTYIGISRYDYIAPRIDLVLHKPNVYWTITGANSLVKVSEEVVCLAFVERNQTFGQAIVIGGYQMEDNLMEFDLARRRIGFSNSFYSRLTQCSNHIYT